MKFFLLKRRLFLPNNYHAVAILYTLYFILYTTLAWRRLNLAVLLLIFALPSYLIRFSFFGVPVTLLEAMIMVVFIVWLIRKLKIKNYELRITNLEVLVALFLLAATIAVFVSPDLRAALGVWKAYFIEPILFLIVLRDLLSRKADKSTTDNANSLTVAQVVRVLSVLSLLLSVFAVCQKFTGFLIPHPWEEEIGRRVTGIFAYPNALALFLAPLMPLFFYQGLSGCGRVYRGVAKLKNIFFACYFLLVTFLSSLAIVWAHSTGALVGIFAGLIFMGGVSLILFPRSDTKFYPSTRPDIHRVSTGLRILHSTFYIFVVVVLLGVGFKILPDNFKNELFLKDWSGQVRQQMWKETGAMLKDHFVFGAGLSGYQSTVAPYHKDKNIEIYLYPHNIVLNFWSETGLLGLLAFVLLIINFSYIGFKKLFTAHYRLLTIATMASMIVLLTHGLVDVPYFKNDLAILFWIIYAIIL